MGEETTIMGTVLSVVFQNEENGYAVLRLVTDDGELLTLVGCVPCAAPGENLTATGSFSSHPQYGEQFSASEVERYLPSNETEILNYLASGVVRGVGPATAEKLVARFGIETLQVLESEPEKLTAIKGMTARRAQEISALEDEHVALLTRYEKTFDLTTIKEAAAAAGMAKPSASQVYYIDLSEPDSVVVYQQKSQNVLSRVLTSLGNGVCAVVEYFK